MITATVNEMNGNLSSWLERANQGVLVTEGGKTKAVMLSLEMFELLMGLPQPTMPIEQLRREFKQALAQAGYVTRDDIMALIQEVKLELAEERLGGYVKA
jgi:PHD/YefM family antitoxin component YafN of YafNO toxin-antitoxin module